MCLHMRGAIFFTTFLARVHFIRYKGFIGLIILIQFLSWASSLRSIAFSRAFQERVAHLMRWGNLATPAKRAASPNLSCTSSCWPCTILEKISASSKAWALVFPRTASVIMEAEAVDMVQPAPSKAISAILPSASMRSESSITSPQVGLCSSRTSASATLPRWWGCLEWSETTAM